MCDTFRFRVAGAASDRARSRRQHGAVLLEVILALVLFVGAAAILTGGLSSSLDGVERLRLKTRAADLAVTVLSELQLGIKSATISGPQPFDTGLEGWTWEIDLSPVESDRDSFARYQKVEVTIRHDESALVHRLSQVIRMGESQPDFGQSF